MPCSPAPDKNNVSDQPFFLTCSLHPRETAWLLLFRCWSSAVDVLPDTAWRHAAHPRETSPVGREEIWLWKGEDDNFYSLKHCFMPMPPIVYAVNMYRTHYSSCCLADSDKSHSSLPWRQLEEQRQNRMYSLSRFCFALCLCHFRHFPQVAWAKGFFHLNLFYILGYYSGTKPVDQQEETMTSPELAIFISRHSFSKNAALSYDASCRLFKKSSYYSLICFKCECDALKELPLPRQASDPATRF